MRVRLQKYGTGCRMYMENFLQDGTDSWGMRECRPSPETTRLAISEIRTEVCRDMNRQATLMRTQYQVGKVTLDFRNEIKGS